MKSNHSFLSKVFSFSLFIVFLTANAVGVNAASGDPSLQDKILRINPEYKISRNSDGSVTVTSKNTEISGIKHEFNDFYADLLMAAYRKQRTDYMRESLSKKYYLSEDDCRREIKHAVNILAEWKIILRDDEIALH